MNKYKCIGTVTLLLFLILIYSYSFINQKQKLKENNSLIEGYNKYLNNLKNYQGILIGENTDNVSNQYNEFMAENSVSHHLFLFLDTIDCYSCFKFHIEEIKKIQLPTIFLTNGNLNQELVKDYLGELLLFKNTYLYTLHKKLFNNNLIVALIDCNGRIIYLDVADKKNYKKSKVFYTVIKNYLNN